MQCTASPSAMPLSSDLGLRARADLDDLAGDLVPEHPRRLDPAVAVVEGAHVGAADAARQDLQEDAVLGAHRVRRGADLHAARPVPDRCAHLPSSSVWTGGSVPVVRQLRRRRGEIEEARMIEFIFMLTRDDVTLADAREVYASVAGTGLRHVGCKDVGLPKEELAALMDDIRSNGHETWIEVVSETEEATLELGPRRGRDAPRPPDRRHADRAGAGDPRRHRREVLALRRADRRPPVPAARLDRRDRRRHRARRRRSASTASTCSPTATTATSRRSSAPSSARPTCRSSAPARSTRSSASARSTPAARGRSRSAPPRSTACSWRARR